MYLYYLFRMSYQAGHTKICVLLCIDILKRYCNKDSRKLELFARNLLPGWTSWGNEVNEYLPHVPFCLSMFVI